MCLFDWLDWSRVVSIFFRALSFYEYILLDAVGVGSAVSPFLLLLVLRILFPHKSVVTRTVIAFIL